MNGYTLETLARKLDGELVGNRNLKIYRLRKPEEAGRGDICVLTNQRGAEKDGQCEASALVVPREFRDGNRDLIQVADPRRALIDLLRLFSPPPRSRSGVHPSAVVSPEARVGPDVWIGPGACIDAEVTLGARVQIHPNVYIGEGVRVGEETEIFPNVTIHEGTQIGERVRIQSGSVIGGDGFGYDQDEAGLYHHIPQVGNVEIEDDVEIGANCTIDRATLGTTRIAAGTKIDNLVQIGHNSEIGERCCIVAQVGISGSVRIGNDCLLAGQVGIRDHVTLADGVTVGAKSGVMDDLTEGDWLGYPALPANQARRVYFLLTRLPELRREIRNLEKRCTGLEKQIQNGK